MMEEYTLEFLVHKFCKFHMQAAKAAREFSKFHKEVEERNKSNCCSEGCVVS